MHCPSCGYPIDQQNLERCPRCGYALTPTTASSSGQGDYGYPSQNDNPGSTGGYAPPPPQPPENPYGGYGAYGGYGNAAPPSGYGPPQQDPSSPYGQYGQYGQGQYGQPAPPSGYGQPAPPSGYGQPAPPSGYGQPAPPSGYGQQPYGMYAPSSYPLAPGYPQPRPPLAPLPVRKSHTGLIVTIVAAVVVVLVACVGGTIWAAQSLGQTTGTGISTAATATIPSGAATATAAPTVAGTVIYQNTFTSNDVGWKDDQVNCFLKSDGYHVANNYSCFAPIGVQKDVNIAVTVHEVNGPTTWPYGIMFRLDDTGDDYQFIIDSNSKWALFKCTADKCDTLIEYTHNDVIQGGLNTPNTLEVHAKGSHFDFFVNGTKVGEADDSTYASGGIGLASGANVEAVFTNLVITRPD